VNAGIGTSARPGGGVSSVDAAAPPAAPPAPPGVPSGAGALAAAAAAAAAALPGAPACTKLQAAARVQAPAAQ
jgi:hypothetical protein